MATYMKFCDLPETLLSWYSHTTRNRSIPQTVEVSSHLVKTRSLLRKRQYLSRSSVISARHVRYWSRRGHGWLLAPGAGVYSAEINWLMIACDRSVDAVVMADDWELDTRGKLDVTNATRPVVVFSTLPLRHCAASSRPCSYFSTNLFHHANCRC